MLPGGAVWWTSVSSEPRGDIPPTDREGSRASHRTSSQASHFLKCSADVRRQRLPDIDELRDGPGVHLPHHIAAMKLDGDFADAKIECDLLIHSSGNHKPQDFLLARRKC